MELILLILIVLIVLAECTAQSFTNRYHHTGEIHLFFTAVGFYAIVVYLLSRAHGYTSMNLANGIWSGLSVVSVALTGIIFFNERVTPSQWVALGLIAVCVGYLISTSPEPKP